MICPARWGRIGGMEARINPYESPRRAESVAAPAITRPGRVASWSAKTPAFYVGAFILHGAMTCGCHFWWSALPVEATPIAWSAFTFFTYRTIGERLLAYLNVGLAILWLWFCWGANLQFFRWAPL